MYGRGRGGFGRAAQLQFERFPEIEDLGKAQYSESKRQLIKWSMDLHNFCKASPYYYKSAKKVEKIDIERYSDRQQRVTNKKRPLGDYIYMDADHLPGELAKAGGARIAKSVQWDIGLDDAFKKVEDKAKGRVNELRIMREADEEDEDEEEVNDNDEEESSGDDSFIDYIPEFDDDEDDYNPDSDNNNEAVYQVSK